MPKSRSKPKAKPKAGSRSGPAKPLRWGGAATRSKDRRWNLLIGAVALLLLIGGAVYAWSQLRATWEFEALAASGSAALGQVETIPSAGRAHLRPGQPYAYPERFPTSGAHDPVWTEPGVYTSPQPPTRLVHALEHGNIVIYYDDPGEEVLERLRDWAALYDGQWDGIVVTPARQLGEAIVLTAWTKRLRLDRFDPEAAAAFIDAYRGRGPEHPVR